MVLAAIIPSSSFGQEIFYFTNMGSSFKKEDMTSESLQVKVAEKGNRELAESLTVEGGPLQAGLMPSMPVADEKKFLETFTSEPVESVGVKKKKASKDKTEVAEPKTFSESKPQTSISMIM